MIKTSHTAPAMWLATIVLAMSLLQACNAPGASHQGTAREVPPRNAEAKYDGIDISSHQGFIDWAKVSSDKNIRFVYIKATEGATYRSPHYAHNITQARRYGLLVGSYHYLTSSSSIDEQFQNFSTYALRSVQDLVPMLDVEVRGDARTTSPADQGLVETRMRKMILCTRTVSASGRQHASVRAGVLSMRRSRTVPMCSR